MGLEAAAYSAETARIQGIDLFGEQQTRIVAALELNAAYINDSLAGRPLTSWVCPSAIAMGGNAYRLGWEIFYNHYATRRGVSMPETQALVATIRPTGSGLHLNWETLAHSGAP